MDTTMLDPEKVFEDSILLTRTIDELSAEIEIPYAQRQMYSGFNIDVNEEIEEIVKQINKRERQTNMLLKFINLLGDKSHSKIHDLKQKIDDEKQEVSYYNNEREDALQYLNSLEEAKSNLEKKNLKLESFIDDLEKNFERVNMDLTIADQELERLQRSKDGQETIGVTLITSALFNSYIKFQYKGYEQSNEYNTKSQTDTIESPHTRTITALKASRVALLEKNKSLQEEIANIQKISEQKEDFSKNQYHIAKAELERLKENELPLYLSYNRQLRELKERFAKLSIIMEAKKIEDKGHSSTETFLAKVSAARKESAQDTPIGGRSSTNFNAKIYEKMQQKVQDQEEDGSLLLSAVSSHNQKAHKSSLWNEMIKLQTQDLPKVSDFVNESQVHSEEDESVDYDSEDKLSHVETLENEIHNLSDAVTSKRESEKQSKNPSITSVDSSKHHKEERSERVGSFPILEEDDLQDDTMIENPEHHSKYTQTDLQRADNIVEEDEDQEEDENETTQPTTRITSIRKDPLQEFFIMTVQCAKLNSPHFNDISVIKTENWYKQVMQEGLPFHKWYEWITNRLVNELYKRQQKAIKIEKEQKEEKKTAPPRNRFSSIFTRWMNATDK